MPTYYPKLNEFIKIVNDAETNKFPQRDLTLLYTYLKRALSLNARLFGHYTARKSALSSFTYEIVPQDKTNLNKAAEAKQRLNNAIESIIDKQLRAVFFGSLLVKLEVKTTPLGNKILSQQFFEPTEYDYSADNVFLFKQDKYGKRIKSNGYNTIETAIDNNYLFDAPDFPHIGGVLRSIMPIEILRYDMMLEYGNYLRKLKGLLQIVNKGGTTEDQTAAEQAASDAVKENFFISSDMIEMKLNQITGSAQNSFKDFLEWIDNSIAITVLGNANTSDLPKYAGSRAALQVQKLISADIFYSDMNRVEKLIDKLLLIDFRINYNPKAVLSDLPYNFRFNLEEEQDIEKNASALTQILPLVPLKKIEVYQKIGFTPPQSGDEIFQGFTAPSI